MVNRITDRKDTAANWTSNNPVLSIGESGFETDTKRSKIGDGTTAWNSLTYRFDKTIADGLYVVPSTLTSKLDASQKGAVSGVAALDSGSKLLEANIPARLSDAQLIAAYVPKWKATTTYLSGDKVLNPNGDVVSAIANFTSGASYNSANWNLSSSYAPIVRKGTFATRPATPPIGTEWVQTDSAGGNLPGTRSFYDGAVWSSQAPGQIAPVGCQSNNWFTTMPGPNPNASLITFATPNAGAGGLSLALFRLAKDITIASLAIRKGTGSAAYTQAIYRLDGATLTRVATTGDLVNPNVDNNIRRDPLLSTVTLTAGTTYYYALTSGTGTFQYYQHTGGSIYTANMLGLTFGDAIALYQSGSFHPAPASIDTTIGTWNAWQNPPCHFGLSST